MCEGPHLDRLGDLLAGVLALADGDTDKLGSDVGKQRVGESVPGAEESADRSVAKQVVAERSRGCESRPGARVSSCAQAAVLPKAARRTLPVAEADAVLARSSSEVEDDAEDDETGQGKNLDEREPELRAGRKGLVSCRSPASAFFAGGRTSTSPKTRTPSRLIRTMTPIMSVIQIAGSSEIRGSGQRKV